MAINGQKISQLTYATLEDAVNDGAQVPVSVDIGGSKTNRRVPIEEIKGYQGNQGNQGNQGASAIPSGISGDMQYNNDGVFGASGQAYTNTQDGTTTSWKINRLLWKTPAADTKTTGVSRISYLNAAELMLYNSSGAIEIANSDLLTRTTYAMFSPNYTHIRQFGASYRVGNINVDDYPSSNIDVDGSIIVFTGSTVTTGTVIMTPLVASVDSMYANFVVRLVNHSVATLSFYGFSIASNETCEFLYKGNGGISTPTFTLMSRSANT